MAVVMVLSEAGTKDKVVYKERAGCDGIFIYGADYSKRT